VLGGKLGWRDFKVAAEARGEILAGIEAIGESHFRDGERRLGAQLPGGAFDAALIEIFHRAAVHQFATILREGRDAHMAMGGEAVERPAFPEINPAVPEILEELRDGGWAGGGVPVFPGSLFHERIQDADEEQVQVTGHAGNSMGPIPRGDAAGQLAERLRKGGGGGPEGIIDVLPAFGEYRQVFRGDHDPLGPDPGLIRPAHADIQDHPVDSAAADVWVAEFVELPGAGDQEITRVQIERFMAHQHIAVARLEEDDLDAFVAMRIQTPILGGLGIPKADAIESGQHVFGHECAGIMPLGERVKFDFALADRLFLRFAIIDPIQFVSRPINWWRSHSSISTTRGPFWQDSTWFGSALIWLAGPSRCDGPARSGSRGRNEPRGDGRPVWVGFRSLMLRPVTGPARPHISLGHSPQEIRHQRPPG
jgi:hypothetical protein